MNSTSSASGGNKYSNYKFVKEDKEEKLKQERRDKFIAKAEKIDLVKAEAELAALERSAYLAPHQKERKHFLEQAIAIVKDKADKEQCASEEERQVSVAKALTDSQSANTRKRGRNDEAGESSDDELDSDFVTALTGRKKSETAGPLDLRGAADGWSQFLTPVAPQSQPLYVAAANSTTVASSAPSAKFSFVPRNIQRPRVPVTQQPAAPVDDDDVLADL